MLAYRYLKEKNQFPRLSGQSKTAHTCSTMTSFHQHIFLSSPLFSFFFRFQLPARLSSLGRNVDGLFVVHYKVRYHNTTSYSFFLLSLLINRPPFITKLVRTSSSHCLFRDTSFCFFCFVSLSCSLQ